MKARLRRIGRWVLPVVIAVSIPILLARCTPQWLPNSSGFVYLASNGTVNLFDLEAKKNKQITALKVPVAGVAMWPTGDRLAVVRFPAAAEPALQVAVYDFAGKELHVSPEFKADGLKTDKPVLSFTSTCVSPDGKHLVLFASGDSTAYGYNFERKEFRVYKDVMPLGMLAAAAASMGEGDRQAVPLGFDLSPVTPDGRGFVAIRTGDEGNFVFHPWDEGEGTELKLDAEQRKGIETSMDDPEKQKARVATVPRWEMGQLVMSLQGGTLRIDPTGKECTYKSDMRSQALLQHAKKHEVAVIAEAADGALFQIKGSQLEVNRNGKTTQLTQPAQEGGVIALSLSPDRKKIVVRSMADGKDVLEVFNVQGEQLAKIENAVLIK